MKSQAMRRRWRRFWLFLISLLWGAVVAASFWDGEYLSCVLLCCGFGIFASVFMESYK